MSYPTITVQTERGTDAAVVTVAAFETAVQRYAHRTLGNLIDLVNERAETEHRSRSWAECIALLADFDFNVDEYAGTPFCTYAPAPVPVPEEEPGYGFFSQNGDRLAHMLVRLARVNGPLTHDQVVRETEAIQDVCITQGHGEASDTACRESIAYALEASQ